jgi:2-oxoglutarate ferredoxin oxidoreductase subunit beta
VSYIKKPVVEAPELKPNKLGLTVRDYEGAMSTLCAGCGHDSVTAAIVRAPSTSSTSPPHMVAKLRASAARRRRRRTSSRARTASTPRTGACRPSSRAPPPPTSAHYIGVSGDGDSLSIGLGQLCHAIRRNVNMLYIIENNGVYGLTKGQFSASADLGSRSKRGEPNTQPPIDPVLARAQPRRDLRRAELLRRQGAARADPQGGPQTQGASRWST